jgi:hypothetical protein
MSYAGERHQNCSTVKRRHPVRRQAKQRGAMDTLQGRDAAAAAHVAS